MADQEQQMDAPPRYHGSARRRVSQRAAQRAARAGGKFGPERPAPRVNLVKWGLGCVGLSMLLFTAGTMFILIVTPVLFRNLTPEYQFRLVQKFPFLAAFQPTRAFTGDYLPTVVPSNLTRADAMALLASPVAPVASPTPGDPGAGSLAAGDDDPLPTATPSPTPTDAPPTITPALATNTPMLSASTPTPIYTATPIRTLLPLPPPTDIPIPVAFHASGFTWEPQDWNNCGPANLTQALKYYGWKGNEAEAAAYLKPNRDDANVSPWQMVDFVNQKTGIRAVMRVGGDVALIRALVSQRFAVILEKGYIVPGSGWMGHYLTVIGYDDSQGLLYGLDTDRTDGPDHRGYAEKYENIDRMWQQFNRLYIVLFPKEREGELAALLGPRRDVNYSYQLALNQARQEASSNPQNAHAWFNLGSNYVLLRQYPQAVKAFENARNAGDGVPWRMLWYQFGPYEAYYNAGNYSEVIELAKVTDAGTKYIEETYYWWGMALAASGKSDEAEKMFKFAQKVNPNFNPAKERLAEVQNGLFKPPDLAQTKPN